MKNNTKNLQKSKIKLALTFSILILSILILFNFIFFFGKYKKAENKDIQILERGAKIFLDLKSEKNIKNRNKKIPERRINFLSFIVKNKKTGEIIFKKDEIGISDEIISKIGKKGFQKIEIKGKFYGVYFFDFKKNGKIIYSFKEINYPKNIFISDFLENSFYSFLISIIIYFLSFLLISKNLKSVEENLKNMDNFIHNAGHELKTPISVISSNLQLALKTGDFKNLNKESLVEIDKMNFLINGLISLSSISAKNNSQKINLKEEIEQICKNNSKKLKEKNIDLKLNLTDFNFKIEKEYFYILFSNIFFNSIKYSEKNGKISIFLKNGKLEIKDDGIGISEKNIEKIFDRFFQEGTGRESSDGFGIGLSLVKKIEDIYKLKILVKSLKGIGTIFTVKF